MPVPGRGRGAPQQPWPNSFQGAADAAQRSERGFVTQTARSPLETRPVALADESSSSEEIDLAYIIAEKPKTKIVREFFRDQLADIAGADELLFGGY